MKQRKKILLRSKSLFGLENQDIFINFEIDNFSKDIKPGSYDNSFDLQAQFDKERNDSREFYIYGDINSVFKNSDGYVIKLFAETKKPTDLSIESNTDILNFGSSQGVGIDFLQFKNGSEASLIDTNVSKKLFGSNNIFGYTQGAYSFSLDNNIYQNKEFDSVYIAPSGDGTSIKKNIIKQTLIYRDSEGDPVDFGSDTEEIRDDGTSYPVFNDFPFFYNSHWIKIPFKINR